MNQNGPHILITGTHRSGTTWVGRTIAQHSAVRYVHEPFSVKFPSSEVDLRLAQWYTHFKSSQEKKEIVNAFDKLLRPSRVQYAVTGFRKSERGMGRVVRLLSQLLVKPKRPRVLVKDPIALLSADWLYEAYDFQVICLIRNPFAFVGSVKSAGWDFDFNVLLQQEELMHGFLSPYAADIEAACDMSGDFFDRACLIWNILHYVILQYRDRYPSWLFVRHEDVAMNPISEFEKIFEYLGLELGQQLRQYIVEYTADRNPESLKSAKYSPRSARGSLETWKERLTRDEINRIGEATGEIAVHFYSDLGGMIDK